MDNLLGNQDVCEAVFHALIGVCRSCGNALHGSIPARCENCQKDACDHSECGETCGACQRFVCGFCLVWDKIADSYICTTCVHKNDMVKQHNVE